MAQHKNNTLYLVANWKMNPTTYKQAESLAQKTVHGIGGGAQDAILDSRINVVICPPSPYVSLVSDVSKGVDVGAQNCFYEDAGAYTGEVSSRMLKSMGCSYCIVGHSERRAMGETNGMVNKKVLALLQEGMRPIIAVGEHTRKADNGTVMVDPMIKRQITDALAGVNERQAKRVIIAYEPVWAIGTGQSADPDDILTVRIFIQKTLHTLYGQAGIAIPILYGGSTDSNNAVVLLKNTGMRGLLVGGASVKEDAKEFIAMYATIQQELL